MTEIPKPPEGILNNDNTITTTDWDTLRGYPENSEEDFQKYIDTIRAPERTPVIGEYASSGLIFSDMVGLAIDLAKEKIGIAQRPQRKVN